MKLIWLDGVWDEYIIWQAKDKVVFKKINELIKNIDRNGYQCIGKPEKLKGQLTSWWSVRFTKKDRLIFRIKNDSIEILQIGTHYGEK